MTAYDKYDFLVVVFVADFLHNLLVALLPLELFLDNAVGHHLGLVAIVVNGTGGVDVVGTGGQNQVGFLQQPALELVNHAVEHALAQNVGMPQQHEFGIARNQFGCDGVEEGVGTMQQDDIWLFLVDDLLEIVVIGEGDVLTRDFHGRGNAVDLDAIDIIHARDTILAETDDNMVEMVQSFGHVFRNGLNATFYGIIIFCYLEYSFLHRRTLFIIITLETAVNCVGRGIFPLAD